MTDQPDPTSSYVSAYQPPSMMNTTPPASTMAAAPEPAPAPMMPSQPEPVMPTAPAPTPAATPGSSDSLADQNIFTLLGVTDGTDEEREAFLDELQQVIWEDFVENDVELLITDEEMTGFKAIMEKGKGPEQQEEMIVYLEKLIPDLEEIMLEKALELKEDMVMERIAGMKEYHRERPEALQQIEAAEQLVRQDNWRAAADTLNAISR